MASSPEVEWETTDPRGDRIVLYKSTVEARSFAGKHQGADAMTTEEARMVVERPERIDVSSTIETRNVYYKYEEEHGKPPYKRVVVETDIETPMYDGIAISWSRYSKPVGGKTTYLNPRNRR